MRLYYYNNLYAVCFTTLCYLYQITFANTHDDHDSIVISVTSSSHSFDVPGCPREVQLDFRLHGENVTLLLTRNDDLTEKIPVMIGHRNSLTRHDFGDSTQMGCFYKDHDNMAAVSVITERHSQDLLWKGVFHTSRGAHSLRPSSKLQRRLRRSYNEILQTVHLTNKINSIGLESIQSYSKGRHRRSGATPLYIGLMAVADYSLYQQWYDRSSSSRNTDRIADALQSIRYHLSHVINEISLRFENIDSSEFSLSVVLKKIVISQEASDSSWTEGIKEPPRSGGSQEIVDAERALNRFKDWFNDNEDELGDFDHAMLFTGLDLYGNNYELSRIGNAVVGGLCGRDRASIIEDSGPYGSATTATHELGHSLNANHDGVNGCDDEDSYIMAPSIEIQTDDTHMNTFLFSPCSINEFEDFIQDLNSPRRVNCLLNPEWSFDPHEWNEYMAILPGQLFDVNEQCHQVYDDESYYCGSQLSAADICRSLLCFNNVVDSCYRLGSVSAAKGTTCGNKMWCIYGDCVYDEDAPSADENCLTGDYRSPFPLNTGGPPITCSQMAAQQPWLCYSEHNANLCCGSCGEIYNPQLQGCEYGDQANWCKDLNAYSCYNNHNKDICCAKCEELRENDDDCPFGDRYDWCVNITAFQCYSNEEHCCKTCKELDTRIPGCKYGDRYRSCTAERSCLIEDNLDGCCETCYSGTLLPTTIPPTTHPAPGGDSGSSQAMPAVDTSESPSSLGISTLGYGFHTSYLIILTSLSLLIIHIGYG